MYGKDDLLKYNCTDGKTILDLEDDAVHANMGGDWRMPTYDDFKELIFNTGIYLVPLEGEEIHGTVKEEENIIEWCGESSFTVTDIFKIYTMKGIKFYRKNDKQAFIFIPASGFAFVGGVRGINRIAALWCSLIGSYSMSGLNFSFSPDYSGLNDCYRYFGNPVRGVMET